MQWKLIFMFLTFLSLNTEALKLRSFYLNKYTNIDHKFDCPYTTRNNITIPGSFTFCYRYKRLFHGDDYLERWAPIFLGQITKDWGVLSSGMEYGMWSAIPWVALYLPSVGEDDALWLAMADEMEFNMMRWRHTCVHFDFDAGTSVIFENGEKLGENSFDEYKDWRKSWPELVISFISVGCIPGGTPAVHPGIFTDFNLFSKKLTEDDMINWTNCKNRITGDLVNWEEEVWSFNTTGNGSTIEFLEYEKDICDMRNNSFQLFPYQSTFPKALDMCEKVSGKLVE